MNSYCIKVVHHIFFTTVHGWTIFCSLVIMHSYPLNTFSPVLWIWSKKLMLSFQQKYCWWSPEPKKVAVDVVWILGLIMPLVLKTLLVLNNQKHKRTYRYQEYLYSVALYFSDLTNDYSFHFPQPPPIPLMVLAASVTGTSQPEVHLSACWTDTPQSM